MKTICKTSIALVSLVSSLTMQPSMNDAFHNRVLVDGIVRSFFLSVWREAVFRGHADFLHDAHFARDIHVDGSVNGVRLDDDGNITINSITKNGNTVIWPSNVGAAGTVLTSDGSGNLVYAVSGGPGGGTVVVDGPFFTSDNRIVCTDIGSSSTNVRESGATLDNLGNLEQISSITFAGSVDAALSADVPDTLSLNTAGVERILIDDVGTVTINGLTTGVVHADATGLLSSSLVVDADVSASAAIADTKLATITTAGKVANSATTATTSSTPNSIVLRNGLGDISVGNVSLGGSSTLTVPAGTAAIPSIQFSGSTNTGFSAPSADTLVFSINGSPAVEIGSTGEVTINGLTTGVVHADATGLLSSSLVVDADVSASAAIADTKLATITTAGKVANSATTATTSSTPNSIVLRNGLGDISVGNVSLGGSSTLTVPAGTAAIPSIQFSGSTNTGFSAPSADTLVFSINGSPAVEIGSTGEVTINGLTTGVVHADATGLLSSSLVVDADVSASAAIADTKLATITTAGKVANSATTATTSSTPNSIVLRNGLGDISVGNVSLGGSSTLTVPAGTAAIPSIQFSGSTNTGFSAPSANTLALSTNGSQAVGIGSTGGVTINGLSTAGVVHNSAAGLLSSSLIVNADINAVAAIADTKLATITTAGKVANSATTATTSNTANTIVLRDGSGNVPFSNATLTAAAGSAASPSINFSGSTTTGFSAPTANTITFGASGAAKMTVGTTEVRSLVRLVAAGVFCNPAIQVEVPPTLGGTVTANSTTSILLLKPVLASAAFTVTFPSSPADGQFFTIMLGTFSITLSFTSTGGSGESIPNSVGSLSLAGNRALTYVFYSADNSWYLFSRA